MVVRQRTYPFVAFQERLQGLVVPRPTVELPQRDGYVVQVEAPAAVVEVDRPRLGAVEQEVLVVEVAVDQAEGSGLLRLPIVASTTSSASANSAASAGLR